MGTRSRGDPQGSRFVLLELRPEARPNTCGCGACANIDRLTIKFIGHAGRALLHRVGSFSELAGPDVILVHRLLKNSVPAREYLLLTDTAFGVLGFDDSDPRFVRGVEHDPDIGDIPVRWNDKIGAETTDGIPPVPRRIRLGEKLRGLTARARAMIGAKGRTFRNIDS